MRYAVIMLLLIISMTVVFIEGGEYVIDVSKPGYIRIVSSQVIEYVKGSDAYKVKVTLFVSNPPAVDPELKEDSRIPSWYKLMVICSIDSPPRIASESAILIDEVYRSTVLEKFVEYTIPKPIKPNEDHTVYCTLFGFRDLEDIFGWYSTPNYYYYIFSKDSTVIRVNKPQQVTVTHTSVQVEKITETLTITDVRTVTETREIERVTERTITNTVTETRREMDVPSTIAASVALFAIGTLLGLSLGRKRTIQT